MRCISAGVGKSPIERRRLGRIFMDGARGEAAFVALFPKIAEGRVDKPGGGPRIPEGADRQEHRGERQAHRHGGHILRRHHAASNALARRPQSLRVHDAETGSSARRSQMGQAVRAGV